jgi:hypothetical protein
MKASKFQTPRMRTRKAAVDGCRLQTSGQARPDIAYFAQALTKVAVGTRISPRPPGRRRRSPAPGSHRTWHADFPHHALRQLVHSFHCYLFKFRFHGQLIFSSGITVGIGLYAAAILLAVLSAMYMVWVSRLEQ